MPKYEEYRIPGTARIGHVHLKVADLEVALLFYNGILGFEITQRLNDAAVFLSAGGYHHHIALNTWHSKNAPQASKTGVGLYHTAIAYETRWDLAMILQRLISAEYPITGAADHGVSESLYLNDPDGNGVELYYDRPKDQWPRKNDGSLDMYTKALHLDELLKELKNGK